jgi:predicted dithiol-disulfide oxidoreductase (DUF899 family)
MFKSNPTVSREEWLEIRKQLLRDEKDFTKARDLLSERRSELPWVKVDKEYTFDGASGSVALGDLSRDVVSCWCIISCLLRIGRKDANRAHFWLIILIRRSFISLIAIQR